MALLLSHLGLIAQIAAQPVPVLRKAFLPKFPGVFNVVNAPNPIEVELHVDEQGKVTKATITKNGGECHRCEAQFVERLFARWQFEVGRAGISHFTIQLQRLPWDSPDENLETEFDPKGVLVLKSRRQEPYH